MTPKKLSTRRRNDKAVADMVDTVMSDTRWDRLRTRPARLTIVAVMIALLVAIPLAWITLPAWAALGLIMVAIGAWWALRMSVRVIADLPEEYLDERQARVREPRLRRRLPRVRRPDPARCDPRTAVLHGRPRQRRRNGRDQLGHRHGSGPSRDSP